MKKTTVKKLVLELDGKDVELTLDQARELLAALSELFGEKVKEIAKPYPVPQPYPVPEPYPVWPRRRWHPWRWPYDEPLWKTSTGTQRPDLKLDTKNGVAICPRHHDELHHTVAGRREARAHGLLGGETYEAAQKAA